MNLTHYINDAAKKYAPAELKRGYTVGFTSAGLNSLGSKKWNRTILPSGGMDPHSEYHDPALRMISRADDIYRNGRVHRTFHDDDVIREQSALYKLGRYLGRKERLRRSESRKSKTHIDQVTSGAY